MGQLRGAFGKRVRALRVQRKLTQTELGRKLGMDYRYVGGIERGEINLTIDTLEKVAAGFGIEPYVLLLFSDDEIMERKDWKIDGLLQETLDGVDIEVRKAVLRLLRLYGSRR